MTIFEAFSHSVNVKNLKIQLALENAVSNCNCKIWFFLMGMLTVSSVMRMNNKYPVNLNRNEVQNKFTFTFVYAKCKDHLQRPL